MPTTEDAIARVKAAIEAAQTAAKNLADAASDLRSKTDSTKTAHLREGAANATDHAGAALAAATEQITKGAAALAAAAKAAKEKAASAAKNRNAPKS